MSNVTRYFVCPPDQVSGYKYSLTPDNDVLPLDVLENSRVVYQDTEKAILHVLISDQTQADIREITGAEDALSIEAVMLMDVAGSYAGMTLGDLFIRFPELSGQRQVGTDPDTGEPIMGDIVPEHKWFRVGF